VLLRVVAGLMLLAGVVAFFAYLHTMGELPTASVAARHLREMKDRSVTPPLVTPATYAAIAALPTGLDVGEYSGIERRAVSLEGHIQRMVRAADDDIHLELVPERQMAGEPFHTYVTAEITPAWRRGSSSWRFPRLVEAFHPTLGGVTPWEGGTRRVRISGWLLFDYEYEPERLSANRPRLSSWEIHPVTRIEVWNDSTGGYQDDPR